MVHLAHMVVANPVADKNVRNLEKVAQEKPDAVVKLKNKTKNIKRNPL